MEIVSCRELVNTEDLQSGSIIQGGVVAGPGHLICHLSLISIWEDIFCLHRVDKPPDF